MWRAKAGVDRKRVTAQSVQAGHSAILCSEVVSVHVAASVCGAHNIRTTD
jgi:hypothetical protein